MCIYTNPLRIILHSKRRLGCGNPALVRQLLYRFRALNVAPKIHHVLSIDAPVDRSRDSRIFSVVAVRLTSISCRTKMRTETTQPYRIQGV